MSVAHSSITAAAGRCAHRARLRASAPAATVLPGLMDGVLGLISRARGCESQDPERRRLVGAACSIIAVLRGSLDASADASLAVNLDDLYEYMCRQLGRAGCQEGSDQLDEVAHLMHELRGAWIALPHVMRPALAGAFQEGA